VQTKGKGFLTSFRVGIIVQQLHRRYRDEVFLAFNKSIRFGFSWLLLHSFNNIFTNQNFPEATIRLSFGSLTPWTMISGVIDDTDVEGRPSRSS
jgi:hypothetical protein